MTYANTVEESLRELVEPYCRAHGVEVVEVRYVPQNRDALVRVMIDKARADGKMGSAVTVDDCTEVGRDINTALEMKHGLVPESFRLEVTSPGLERPLIKLEDFVRFVGNEVRIVLKQPLDGRRKYRGDLQKVEGDRIFVKESGRVFELGHGLIEKAELIYPFADSHKR